LLKAIEPVVLEASVTSAPQRIPDLRNRPQLEPYPDLLVQQNELNVSILEYRIHHPAGVRAKPIETFHAKIVMSDGSAAYVGSANLMESSQEIALECGFIIEGPAVAQVTDIVEAILRLASKG
jgi:phosphatidylserine/phosphatidylglycerophosphate/cardiolipin synthase-like enzyme